MGVDGFNAEDDIWSPMRLLFICVAHVALCNFHVRHCCSLLLYVDGLNKDFESIFGDFPENRFWFMISI